MNISISVTIYTPWFIPKYHPATQDEGDAESGIQVSKYNIEKLAHLRTELLRGRGPTYRPPSACGILQFITAAGGSPELN